VIVLDHLGASIYGRWATMRPPPMTRGEEEKEEKKGIVR